jgi:hypothetical protein
MPGRYSLWGQRSSWLLIAGDIGGQESVLTGESIRTDLSVQQGLCSQSVSLTCELTDAVLRTGQRQQGGPRPVEAMLWEALQTWPDKDSGRRWPPEMKALLALARKHPQEYESLCEEIYASSGPQLMVVPDVWAPDGRILRGTEALGGLNCSAWEPRGARQCTG